MQYKDLDVERDRGVVVLTLNRLDKRNALSPSLLAELSRALSDEDRNPETRAVVVTGAGEKAFCAGFDLSELDAGGRSEMPANETELIESSFSQIRKVGKPVVAMINGVCMGAGCDLITNCDYRIAAEDASFALPPARLGIVYRWEGTLRFMRLVGLANAKDIFMTGRILGAAEAHRIGLVNRTVPKSRLREETIAYALMLVEAAPLSVWGAKRTIDILSEAGRPSPEALREISAVQLRVWQSNDSKEGARAFLEKRRPVFRGK